MRWVGEYKRLREWGALGRTNYFIGQSRKNRFRVEQVIGIVKNRFGDRDCVRDFHVASLYVLARFALYNLILLYKLLLLWLNLLRAHTRFFLLSVSVLGIF